MSIPLEPTKQVRLSFIYSNKGAKVKLLSCFFFFFLLALFLFDGNNRNANIDINGIIA